MRTSRLISACLRYQQSCRLASSSTGTPRLCAGTPYRHLTTTFASTSTSTATTPSLFNPPGETKPFFVTTPIFYVNAAPHIGHLHSLVLTDVLARFAKLRRPDRGVIFTTGTDEHGLKIQQAAAAQGVPEEEFCARVSERFKDLADKANVEYTDFIRTSEARHYAVVEHFWKRLIDSGDVYKGSHTGWYSVSDECFYSAQQVTKDETTGKTIATETGNEVVWEEEENWKFKLPKYKDKVSEWLAKPEAIYPEHMREFVKTQVETAEDLSISRPNSRVRWGVPVPGDSSQTIYVWVDALINYLTVLGYPEMDAGWPADVHVVGKDIVKFHAVHWPALLMAARHTPPRRILAHAHWTMGRFKMSKSRGNVVDPISAIDLYGADVVRWYLMRSGGALPADSDYSAEQLGVDHQFITAQIGNLLNRLSSASILKKVSGEVTEDLPQIALEQKLSTVRDDFERRMEEYGVTKACEEVAELLLATNKMFTDLEPWRMKDTTIAVIYAHSALRTAAILLQPILPLKMAELLDRLGVAADKRTWGDAAWSGQSGVDAGEVKRSLMAAAKEWKGRGYLFPKVEVEAEVKA